MDTAIKWRNFNKILTHRWSKISLIYFKMIIDQLVFSLQ